jgi:hypothetical protein
VTVKMTVMRINLKITITMTPIVATRKLQQNKREKSIYFLPMHTTNKSMLTLGIIKQTRLAQEYLSSIHDTSHGRLSDDSGSDGDSDSSEVHHRSTSELLKKERLSSQGKYFRYVN